MRWKVFTITHNRTKSQPRRETSGIASEASSEAGERSHRAEVPPEPVLGTGTTSALYETEDPPRLDH